MGQNAQDITKHKHVTQQKKYGLSVRYFCKIKDIVKAEITGLFSLALGWLFIYLEGTVSGSGTGPLDYGATGPVPDP